MSRKARKAKNFVEEGLEKVRSRPWAEPLGKALGVSGKIVGVVEGLVPGANIIGGALSFGATLLNPAPTIEDLQKELRDIACRLSQSPDVTFEDLSLAEAFDALVEAQLEIEKMR